MLRVRFAFPALVIAGLVSVGCASKHEEGVKSTYLWQTAFVQADTKTTTEAARAVLEEKELKDVTASSTNVDGSAMGKKANGAVVKVTVNKEGTGSNVKVGVGTLGDPEVGAEIAKMIKNRAEMSGTNTTGMNTTGTNRNTTMERTTETTTERRANP
ncbi:MAG: hypothetical protein H7144_06565 [Burkholderiales bacterium]|nr:hypothetical protein [Phycisphaerae bacterium]